MSKLLQINSVINGFSRSIGRCRGQKVYNWNGEGVQYTGFKYYPKTTDLNEAPITPSKLFRVQRIKPLKHLPHWEKSILKELGLIEKMGDVSIVKNIPEINAKLWRIKHLIKIAPITFPNGLPSDNIGTKLKENGELIVMKKLEIESKLEATESFQNDPKRLNGDTLRRDSRKKWLSGW